MQSATSVYVIVMLLRGVLLKTNDFLDLFEMVCWLAAAISLACVALSWRYFSASTTQSPVVLQEPHA